MSVMQISKGGKNRNKNFLHKNHLMAENMSFFHDARATESQYHVTSLN
jgi:hypothetical protein